MTTTHGASEAGLALPTNAKGQRCLYCGAVYPLFPPIMGGCPACADGDFLAPLEVIYDYPAGDDWLPEAPLPGLARYAAMLPPVVERLSMGEGGTPLITYADDDLEVFIKDESRNPTWSHKDRLNFAVMSAALLLEVPGIVAASSGNHGGAAAAYSARAGLPGVILCTPRPPAVASFLQAYGQLVVAVPDAVARWTLMERLINDLGLHPISNYTTPPTNHPFGSEGYKTIAYELFLQLDRRAPEAVFIPVGYAELTFGVYKGFVELRDSGLIRRLPRIIGCEPTAGAPLKRAIEEDKPSVSVDVADSDAYAIAVPVNSYRGVVAVKGSDGAVLAITEDEMKQAQRTLGRAGMWAEISSAIAFAGALGHARELGLGQEGPLVCVNTSSGFKDSHVGEQPVPFIDGGWDDLVRLIRQSGLPLDV
jgi:threonine synthase